MPAQVSFKHVATAHVSTVTLYCMTLWATVNGKLGQDKKNFKEEKKKKKKERERERKDNRRINYPTPVQSILHCSPFFSIPEIWNLNLSLHHNPVFFFFFFLFGERSRQSR
jgi:hypothetical protein